MDPRAIYSGLSRALLVACANWDASNKGWPDGGLMPPGAVDPAEFEAWAKSLGVLADGEMATLFAIAASSPMAETEDHKRRYAKLLELGGSVTNRGVFKGFKKLVAYEVRTGAARRSEKTIREDLKRAHGEFTAAARAGSGGTHTSWHPGA